MMRTLFAASCLAGIVIAGAAAAPVYAGGGNPSGTGPPNQSCQNTATGGQITVPGHSGSSPGSVFNEPGFGSVNGGTGGSAYNNAGAPSQYDVACVKNASGGLSPSSTSMAPTTTAPTGHNPHKERTDSRQERVRHPAELMRNRTPSGLLSHAHDLTAEVVTTRRKASSTSSTSIAMNAPCHIQEQVLVGAAVAGLAC
jgi:hypothetical protein